MNVLVIFNGAKVKIDVGFNLIINFVSSSKFNVIDDSVINIGLENNFSQSDFNAFKELIEGSKSNLIHGNNIYNYYFQVLYFIRNKIAELVDVDSATLHFQSSIEQPEIYYTGLMEQIKFPFFSLESCFSYQACKMCADLGFKTKLHRGSRKEFWVTKLRNVVLPIIIFIKLFISIISHRNLNNELSSKTKIVLVRNEHQYRVARKIKTIDNSFELLLIPSLSGMSFERSECLSLQVLVLLKILLSTAFIRVRRPRSLDLDLIETLSFNSNNLSIDFYQSFLVEINSIVRNDAVIISFEQLSPQAFLESIELDSDSRCLLGIQTTTIEKQEYYCLSPFNRFLTSTKELSDYFYKHNNVMYRGDLDYSYLKKSFEIVHFENKEKRVVLLTQAYNVQESVISFQQAISAFLSVEKFNDYFFDIILHPRDNESDYKALNVFRNVNFFKSNESIYEHIHSARFIFTRTTSLVHDSLCLGVPVFSLLFNPNDRGLDYNFLNYVYRCNDLDDFLLSITTYSHDFFITQRDGYLSGIEMIDFEKIL